MTVVLVRHALLNGSGADMADRGLSERGRRQAHRLTDMLSAHEFDRVLSSTASACVETVQPLATARTLVVETDALLDGDPVEVDAVMSLLLADCGGGIVACAGSEVIAAVMDAVRASGCELLLPEGDTTVRWKKGSAWLLECHDTNFDRATYQPPPPRAGTPGAHTHPSFTAKAPRSFGSS